MGEKQERGQKYKRRIPSELAPGAGVGCGANSGAGVSGTPGGSVGTTGALDAGASDPSTLTPAAGVGCGVDAGAGVIVAGAGVIVAGASSFSVTRKRRDDRRASCQVGGCCRWGQKCVVQATMTTCRRRSKGTPRCCASGALPASGTS